MIGKIYYIGSSQTDEIYIGSTFLNLNRRLNLHRSNKKKCTSMRIIKFDDHYIELIEEYDNICEKDLKEIERIFIKNCDKVVNKVIPNRTRKEYYEDYKDHITLQKKEYYIKNKKDILVHRKDHYKKNKKSLEYYYKNRDAILEKYRLNQKKSTKN